MDFFKRRPFGNSEPARTVHGYNANADYLSISGIFCPPDRVDKRPQSVHFSISRPGDNLIRVFVILFVDDLLPRLIAERFLREIIAVCENLAV